MPSRGPAEYKFGPNVDAVLARREGFSLFARPSRWRVNRCLATEATMLWVPVVELGASAKVVQVSDYSDGTTWWIVEDAEGKRAIVCIDGHKGSATQNRLFEGTAHTHHPCHPKGRLLELGGPEEGIVVPLLSRWIDANAPKHVCDDYFIERIQDALLRLGQPSDRIAGETSDVDF